MEPSIQVLWTDYVRYRARLRGFELAQIEHIVRHSAERYRDAATGRMVAVGRHGRILVIVPYEATQDTITPITIHAITRQQISFRLKTGRFVHE